MTDNHITFRLYIPLGMIILLMIMIFFHRNHMYKYLYIISSLCLFVAVLAYFAMTRYLAGDRESGSLMQAVPIIWLVGIFGGYILSILSFVVFIIEQAQRHLWAKGIIGIAGVALILLSIWGIYMLIRGISSLKSG